MNKISLFLIVILSVGFYTQAQPQSLQKQFETMKMEQRTPEQKLGDQYAQCRDQVFDEKVESFVDSLLQKNKIEIVKKQILPNPEGYGDYDVYLEWDGGICHMLLNGNMWPYQGIIEIAPDKSMVEKDLVKAHCLNTKSSLSFNIKEFSQKLNFDTKVCDFLDPI